jgi:putative two-component system response regulator
MQLGSSCINSQPAQVRDRQESETPILIVDDEAPIRSFLETVLEQHGYKTRVAANTAQARLCLKDSRPALMLCDVNMPGESGLELIKEILRARSDIAVIMVTGIDDSAVGSLALEMGAYGYLVKPFRIAELLINVENALRRHRLECQARSYRDRLERIVLERTQSLQDTIALLKESNSKLTQAQEETIFRLARAAESRDEDTGEHVQRMSKYCEAFARFLDWPAERCQDFGLASSLHDIGKIAIPDRVLLKPGKLDMEEFVLMKQHPEHGYRILEGSTAELLRLAGVIAWTHHERYDGSGYPRGLKADGIPLEGRVTTIADVFDALTNARPYKPAFPVERAVEIMRKASGSQFDPVLLDLFLGKLDDILAIKQRYSTPANSDK